MNDMPPVGQEQMASVQQALGPSLARHAWLSNPDLDPNPSPSPSPKPKPDPYLNPNPNPNPTFLKEQPAAKEEPVAMKEPAAVKKNTAQASCRLRP